MSRFDLDRKISLRLDKRLCEKLQDFADHERVPVSSVMRHLVIRFFEGKPALKASLLGPSRSVRPGQSTLPSRVERLQAEFSAEVCALFDGFRGQGYDVKEAAKRTNYELKERNHPWATYEAVAEYLRKAGRFRKAKGVKN